MTKPSLQPSLLDSTDTYQAKKTGSSLLASLSNSPIPSPKKKRSQAWLWFVLLPLILISLVVAAAVTITDRISSSSITNTPNSKPVAASAISAKPNPAPIQAATIINDPINNNPHDRLTQALAEPQIRKPTSTADETSATSTATSAPIPNDPLTRALSGPTTSSTTPPANKTTSTAAPTATKSTQKNPAAAPSKPAIQKEHNREADDRDVKLLTALVASTPITKEQSTKTHNTKHTTSKPQTSPKDDSRDVVERKPGDSTASLLARCKKLGMIEGELCRWRICSDRWDTDPVCKANAHAKSSTPDTPAQ
jgi:hypothetical protein